MASKEFQITEEQRKVLAIGFNGGEFLARSRSFSAACVGMVKRGWLVAHPGLRTHYRITDAGRAVARQLGIEGGGA